MKEGTTGWRVAAIACLLLLAVGNLFLTALVLHKVDKGLTEAGGRPSLPCKAIPVRFVMEEPYCADRLLQAMNVSNVHIMSRQTAYTYENNNVTGPFQRME